jgi:arylsulfatase
MEVAKMKDHKERDGISLYNTLVGDGKQENHDYLYWEYPEYGGQVAIRKGDYKVIWKDIKKGNKDVEVYNLKEDLQELNNLAEMYPEKIDEFFNILCEEHETPRTKRFLMKAIEDKCGSK